MLFIYYVYLIYFFPSLIRAACTCALSMFLLLHPRKVLSRGWEVDGMAARKGSKYPPGCEERGMLAEEALPQE